jgi:hypothetical protein
VEARFLGKSAEELRGAPDPAGVSCASSDDRPQGRPWRWTGVSARG